VFSILPFEFGSSI